MMVLVFGACVAAVKSRPVPHHCVVIFFWSSGSMECTCMLFTLENGVPLMRYGASVVWHHSLLVMNGFNKTDAAVFSCRLCFLGVFPIISLLLRLFDYMCLLTISLLLKLITHATDLRSRETNATFIEAQGITAHNLFAVLN